MRGVLPLHVSFGSVVKFLEILLSWDLLFVDLDEVVDRLEGVSVGVEGQQGAEEVCVVLLV